MDVKMNNPLLCVNGKFSISEKMKLLLLPSSHSVSDHFKSGSLEPSFQLDSSVNLSVIGLLWSIVELINPLSSLTACLSSGHHFLTIKKKKTFLQAEQQTGPELVDCSSLIYWT